MNARLNARAIALAFVVLGLFAASADARTTVIKSKVVIQSVNDDFSFNVVVQSPKARCLKTRAIGYEVPGVSDSGTTGPDGTFTFGGDWHDSSDAHVGTGDAEARREVRKARQEEALRRRHGNARCRDAWRR
jgi:hypothetical protein